MPGYQKIFKTKIIPQYAFYKFLASPMFCLEYMISSDLIFSMELRISLKKNVIASRAVQFLQESPYRANS